MSIGIMGRQKNNRGVSTIEMSLVLILLLLMVFGITEVGRAFYQYNTLAKAIRDGARYIIKQSDLSGQSGNAKNLVVYGNTAGSGSPLLKNLTPGNVEIVYMGIVPANITVRINGFQFDSMFPDIFPFQVNLSPTITMPYLFKP
jgi:hypothetical protein